MTQHLNVEKRSEAGGEVIIPSAEFWGRGARSDVEVAAVRFCRFLVSESCRNCNDVISYKLHYGISIVKNGYNSGFTYFLINFDNNFVPPSIF